MSERPHPLPLGIQGSLCQLGLLLGSFPGPLLEADLHRSPSPKHLPPAIHIQHALQFGPQMSLIASAGGVYLGHKRQEYDS